MSRRAGAMRAVWNLVDQVISSATNALLSFLIARSVTNSDFGGFTVAFTIFSVFIGISRAVSPSPLSVRFAGAETESFRRETASGVGTALAIGLVGGLGCVVAGAVVGGAAGAALLALGVALPGLLVQDAWRIVFIAEARPQAAVVNDLFWAVLQIGAIVALVELGWGTVGLLTLAWGMSAGAAALLGLRQAGVRPRPSQALSWIRDHRDLTGYLVLEYATVQGFQQLALLVIGSVGSLAALGAIRGANVLLGPTTIFAVGMFSYALPEFSRRREQLTMRGWVLGAVGLSAVVTGLGLVWGVIFLFVPDEVGVALLGDTWAATEGVILATIVQQAGTSFTMGPAVMLYAMDRARVTLRIHLVLGPLLLVGGVGGVLLGGAQGAALGFAAAFWALAPAWWISMTRQARLVSAAAGRTSPPSAS